jgi:hypothetical protein
MTMAGAEGMDQTFVGMQVGAISFIDEGVAETLDRFVELAGVNAICVSALSWSRGNAGRATGGFPDHGGQEPDDLQGGAFFRYDPRYFEGTSLKHFAAPDPLYRGFDALGDVIPEARRRGMAVYPYYCETAHATPSPRWQPGFAAVLEIDAGGRRASRPCLRHPDYRAWWSGVIDNWLNEYDLDGVMWGIERQGPLSAMLEGDVATCFCVHCRQEAARRGIDAERAAHGYRVLAGFLDQARAGERPPGGYLITFMRILGEHPEIGQWERLWLDAHKSLYREVHGQVKFHGDRFQVGLGVWQMINTFNPWLRAQHDPAELAGYADWLKPVLYNVPAGARFAAYVRRLCQTVLRDATPEEWTPVLYRILGLDEAAFTELPETGFRPDYVRDHTARFVGAVGPGVRLYPGLGIGVEGGVRGVTPQDVEAMVAAAFEGGAAGVMISRNYSEMTLENLAAVGKTLRTLGKLD